MISKQFKFDFAAARAAFPTWIRGPRTDESPYAPLEAHLRAVNGKASSHVLKEGQDVRDLVDRAEELLDEYNIPKTLRVGAELYYRGDGGHSVSGRVSQRIVSEARFRRTGKGWVLTYLGRAGAWPGNPEIFTLTVRPEVRERVVAQATRHFEVAA